MNILCIGDVIGASGCEFMMRHLPSLRKLYAVDLVIANGENSAEGNGLTPASADMLFNSGVDVITTGNHVFRRKEIYPALDENPRILRPANYPAATPGKGWTVVDTVKAQVCVINLLGTVFMDPIDSAFEAADAILASQGEGRLVIVDMHAEATSEKRALAFYLDGRVSAVFGTHTHVQTADEEILPHGTGFITDLGMTGPTLSVLGIDPQPIIRRFLTRLPSKFSNATTPCSLSGVLLDINTKTRQTNLINRIQVK
ncbi:MAG: TIGR00282 family metallophosphoesterase [Clostridia bacterium]|nr:TIGR00282 family metallophosphoesterase [Clostridia bacterium]